MVIHPAVHTLREAGFKLRFADHDLGPSEDWVIVGQWNSSNVHENINATIQIEQIRATFGGRRCTELQYGEYRIVAAEDADDVAVLIAEQLTRYEEEGMIDDADYWNKIAPLVEDAWTDLPTIERIRLIRTCDASPDLLFADELPHEFFSELAAVVVN